MIERCYKENNKDYNMYGGRGVVVCDEWLNDKTKFFDWAINNDYREDLTIDRIDPNGNYEPDNCRWTDRKQQTRNRRNTKYIEYLGETKPLGEWCEILGLNYKTVYHRLMYYNWPIEKAFKFKEMIK